MCTDAAVLKLLHLGESWRCRKNGYCLLGRSSHDRKFLVATECRNCKELVSGQFGPRQEIPGRNRACIDPVS